MAKVNKLTLPRVFAMIQFYGETLEHLRYVNHSEGEILEKNFFNPSDVGRLLELRTQKGQLEIALKTIAIELDEEHDFCIPGITGWRMVDQHRFHIGRFPSISYEDSCMF
jgi:hypothetical protein